MIDYGEKVLVCPKCGHEKRGVGEGDVEPGCLVACLGCKQILVFDENMDLAEPSPEDLGRVLFKGIPGEHENTAIRRRYLERRN